MNAELPVTAPLRIGGPTVEIRGFANPTHWLADFQLEQEKNWKNRIVFIITRTVEQVLKLRGSPEKLR
jgi:hypothetical protein